MGQSQQGLKHPRELPMHRQLGRSETPTIGSLLVKRDEVPPTAAKRPTITKEPPIIAFIIFTHLPS